MSLAYCSAETLADTPDAQSSFPDNDKHNRNYMHNFALCKKKKKILPILLHS